MDNLTKIEQTRDRILQAATEVFAQSGVLGATTREIARVAGVNEVTLFRHFQSKERLLGEVVQRMTALQREALQNSEEWTQDLYEDLSHYAQLYDRMLETHEAFIRTFIGEAKRHPQAAQQIISEAMRPLREQLIAYIEAGIQQGVVDSEIDPAIAVDQFTGMLLAGMLRRNAAPTPRNYSRERYLESCVNLFVRGIGTNKFLSTSRP